MYSVGDSQFGKLGNGSFGEYGLKEKSAIFLMDRAVDVATGKNHSVIVTDEGNVHTFGCGKFGQLGHGSVDSEATPRVIEDFINRDIRIVSAACGDNHTICLTDSGLVYGFGCGSSGQLGILCCLNKKEEMSLVEKSQLMFVCSPKLVQIMRPLQQETEEYRRLRMKKTFVEIDKVKCGSDYSAFLTKQGQLWMCGSGLTGVICNGTFVSKNYEPSECQFKVPEKKNEYKITIDIDLSPGEDGESIDVKFMADFDVYRVQPPVSTFLPYCHEKPYSQTKTPKNRAISSPHWKRYLPKIENPVPDQPIKIIDYCCGNGHMLCISREQRVFAAGLNFNGQLGIKNKTSQCRLIEITHLLPYRICVEGIQQIICGTDFSVIITAAGNAFAAGRFPGNHEDSTSFVEIDSLKDSVWFVDKMYGRNSNCLFVSRQLRDVQE